jgi:hypothetical protein
MWFFLKKVELEYKTHRVKSAVINSLNEIASFKGDSFKFPYRVIGNPLIVKSKLVVGVGQVTTDEEITIVTVTIRPAGQLKVAFLIFTLMAFLPFIAAFGLFFFDGKVLLSFGLLVMAMLFLSVPRIMYFFVVQMRQNSLEYLVLTGNRA